MSDCEDVAASGMDKMVEKLKCFKYERNGVDTAAGITENAVESQGVDISSKKRKRRENKIRKKFTFFDDDSSENEILQVDGPQIRKNNSQAPRIVESDEDNGISAADNLDEDHEVVVSEKLAVTTGGFRKKNSRMRLESSSEGEEGSATGRRVSPVCEPQDGDIEEKEAKLRKLREMFPRADSMELQDALMSNGWSLQAAIDSVLVNSSPEDSSGGDSGTGNSKSRSHQNRRITANKRKRLKTSSHHGSKGWRKERGESSKKPKDLLDSDCNFSAREVLYDSDDSDIDAEMTPAKEAVLSFLERATAAELSQMPECSKKKVGAIFALRPFVSWVDLVLKLQHGRGVSTDLLQAAQSLLAARKVVTKLMDRCEAISNKLAERVLRLISGEEVDDRLTDQPASLNKNLSLTPHQMLGLNWLVLLHKQKVNGILADEMGLGKTIQTIAFLAYLMDNGVDGPFAIIVPSSTMDNWQREIRAWAPHMNVVAYQGSQPDRSSIRYNIIKGTFDNLHVLVSSYQTVIANPEDRALFRRVRFRYAVFDEAHMLKNMTTKRYKHLMGVNAQHRLLLTGTPLQNSLIELMSLLTFVVPDMFDGKTEHITKIFSTESRHDVGNQNLNFEMERIVQAKQIMRPFVLRRMKSEVLKTLPGKRHETVLCSMTADQADNYKELVQSLRQQMMSKIGTKMGGNAGAMQLRKLANHPLLLRYRYTESELRKMARLMLNEPTHRDADERLVLEDMRVMSDFELHKLCNQYKSIRSFALPDEVIATSGKFAALDRLLPDIKSKGERVLVFSQFVMLLDILEEYVKIRGHAYVRFDGSTATADRQQLIDEFTANKDVFLFLLSTKAGGLGVNLAAANVVILHDIGFNPYDEKQAEDRCHRLGQTKEVTVIHLIGKGTIDEHILKLSEKKLKLERDLTATSNDTLSEEGEDVATLLKAALDL